MFKRVHVYYSGDVQGVGFRYTTLSIAKRYLVKGWVKNLSDGRVELVAEGEESTLKEFLSEIKSEMGRYTYFKEELSWSEPTNEFKKFEIRF